MESVVVGDPRYAGFWIRVAAYVLDYMVIGVAAVVIGLMIGFPLGLVAGTMHTPIPDTLYDVVGYGIAIPLVFFYMTLFESSSRQATPGKLAMGIKVTDMNGGRISFGRASGRWFAKCLSGLLCLAGYIMVGLSEKKQGLHDRIASTLVVRKATQSP